MFHELLCHQKKVKNQWNVAGMSLSEMAGIGVISNAVHVHSISTISTSKKMLFYICKANHKVSAYKTIAQVKHW